MSPGMRMPIRQRKGSVRDKAPTQHVRPRHLRSQHQDSLHQQRPRATFLHHFLSNFGYGAFDPLESFFYRDVLRVGVEWMGWLSSASGVGAVLGAVLALRLPPHLVNLKTLLVALMSVGLGSLLYVGTSYVAWPSSARSPWA